MTAFLRDFLLPDGFVIDEKPLPIYLSRQEGLEGLSDLIAGVMRENERLQDLNIQLQKRSAQPVEVEKIMRGLLPTLDGFDRVLGIGRGCPQSEELDNWLKSVESVYFRLLMMLESYGLFQIKTVGKRVDLNLHEVVEYRKSDDSPNDVIISERQKGYVFRGKLLRDAKVVVAYNERR